MFKYIQNFCHGDFFISFVKIQKIDFFEGSCFFFQAFPQIQLSSKIDWLGFHTKSDSSLRLIKIFCSIYLMNLLFFRAYSSRCIWRFYNVSWCYMMDKKNSKPFETVNFTRTSEISDNILNTLWYFPKVGTRVDFLKLEFSILIVWQPNFSLGSVSIHSKVLSWGFSHILR